MIAIDAIKFCLIITDINVKLQNYIWQFLIFNS